MNPINDEMPSKDTTDVQKSSELSNTSNENCKEIKLKEDSNDRKKIIISVKIQETEENTSEKTKIDSETKNEKTSENIANEKNICEENITRVESYESDNASERDISKENEKDIIEENTGKIKIHKRENASEKDIRKIEIHEPENNASKKIISDENTGKNRLQEQENPSERDIREENVRKIENHQLENYGSEKNISEENIGRTESHEPENNASEKDISEENIGRTEIHEPGSNASEKDISEENVEKSENNTSEKVISKENSRRIDIRAAENNANEKDIGDKNPKNNESLEPERNSEIDLKRKEQNQDSNKNVDGNKHIESISHSDDDSEEYEDDENVEDIESPGEQEVEEIIVPDEAEAEDLTDDKYNEDESDKSSLHGDDVEYEEDLSSKVSEIGENEIDLSLYEEETTKSSGTEEKDEDSDKKSINNDEKEDTASKDFDETEIAESPIEEPKSNEPQIDEETNSQATYDPLNCTYNKEQDDENNDYIAKNANCIDNVSKNADIENSLHFDKNVENENSLDVAENIEKENSLDVAENIEKENSLDVIENENSLEEDTNVENENPPNIAKNGKNEKSLDSKSLENAEHEEDDEVQFVETRNSPICIESDDDENNSKDNAETCLTSNNNNNKIENNKRIITTATTIVTVPKNITVTRTSARKSTAKAPQNPVSGVNNNATVPQMQNKTRNFSFSYLQKSMSSFNKRTFSSTSAQKIVDCIELLDSSDEESTISGKKKAQQQQKTPQKRTLLAAKGIYYKNNSKTTNTVPPNRLLNNLPMQIRQQPKKPAPPPLPPPTPQSNFLNAVQLQPSAVTGANPPAFSALLSNKSVIIPNAFYGNPPSIRGTPEMEIDRRYVRWLENFINQICKPQFEPTHSCFVFLQRSLKYKDFVRIKAMRANMNSHVQSASNQLNIQLMTDLKTIFFKNRKITNIGRRFCEFTCSAVPGKAVALMSHRVSGKVTLKTCNMDPPKPPNLAVSSTSTSSFPAISSSTRKRQLDEDEDEYTPDKSTFKTSENGDEDSGDTGDDRKRSLRTKRTKRLDNSFSYNEDDLLAEYEIEDEDDEKLAQVVIQRKIEQKRLEAQKQRQQQVKSFESAFIQAFAKTADGPTTSSKTSKNATNQRIRLKNTASATVTSVTQYTANNDAEDLLQATWIENLENDDTQVISDDDEPREHRIYKQQELKEQIHQQQQEYYAQCAKLGNIQHNVNPSPKISSGRTSKRIQEEIITGDDDYEENDYYSNNSSNVEPLHWPKNNDPQMHITGKNKDRCVICNLNCQRLVHHYVNEHRGCEVYNSRLSSSHIKLLKQGNFPTSNVSLYKNGQYQYEAFCIFCQKMSRFMLPYWYQHFTMHTGEYAYRCIGCGLRKPTRSLLTQHQQQGCPEVGGVVQDYAHDPKSLQIEAKICSICNYVQLHRSNIVKHLHNQHNIKQILPKHIQTLVLLKLPLTMPVTSPTSSYSGLGHNRQISSQPSSSSYSFNTFIIDEDENNFTYEEILPEESHPQPENHYYNYIPPYMQAAVNSGNFSFENVDAGDDLSFMICGMLDVQMNNDAN